MTNEEIEDTLLQDLLTEMEVDKAEEELTDMFGEGGKEEVKEYYSNK